jgi:hypothetical protein
VNSTFRSQGLRASAISMTTKRRKPPPIQYRSYPPLFLDLHVVLGSSWLIPVTAAAVRQPRPLRDLSTETGDRENTNRRGLLFSLRLRCIVVVVVDRDL